MKAKKATANSHIHHWLKSSSASVGLFFWISFTGALMAASKKVPEMGTLVPSVQLAAYKTKFKPVVPRRAACEEQK